MPDKMPYRGPILSNLAHICIVSIDSCGSSAESVALCGVEAGAHQAVPGAPVIVRYYNTSQWMY